MSKLSERERLSQLVHQWNVDHYDLFELNAPNQDLEFHGVVRFYFQGGEGANVITKCIRVSSSAITLDVIDTLIVKFRPDMRMLCQNKYALYEVHINGDERRLGDNEKPLWVQLNWGKDVREGRFLLKKENEKTLQDAALCFKNANKNDGNFKRKLSKREKKEKKHREERVAKESQSVSAKLYTEAPETSFTRSISNPEAVMRRRRQQKLEKKLAQMQNIENGPNSGGTLKIYGDSLQPDVPYKTLLLSTADTTSSVIKEALEKYGLEKEEPEHFVLVMVVLPPGHLEYHGGSIGEEHVLAGGECPLAIVLQRQKNQGHVIFQLHRLSPDHRNEQHSTRQRAVSHDDLRKGHDMTLAEKLPYLLEFGRADGRSHKHLLPLNVTEVVKDKPRTPGNQVLQLNATGILPRHCVIAHTEGIVTVTPMAKDAEVYVEEKRVWDTTMLRHGMTVRFGYNSSFKFVDPLFVQDSRGQSSPAARVTHPHETNFDVDGSVETVARQHAAPAHVAAQPQVLHDSFLAPTMSNGRYPGDQLPGRLDFKPEVEDRLLQAVILEVNSRVVQFKLAPTYTLYLAVRRLLLSAHSAHLVAGFASKTSKLIKKSIQDQYNDPTSLAFWMANASEILHFFKHDLDMHAYGIEWHELMAGAVQMAFNHLLCCLRTDLQHVLPAFLDPSDSNDTETISRDQYNQGPPVLADVLNTLSAAMTMLRRCRVNAALTIQLFSQLFHFINTWLFNILVMEPKLQLCTRVWGRRLKRRLVLVEAWAEKQGLELAADCHLCGIIQAAHLLQSSKLTADDVTNISSTCFKLNSIQMRVLLSRYWPEQTERPVSPTFTERVVGIAENMADELTRTDGREVRLEEDPDLHLPFLLPEDGYSCDTIRGIPNGLPEFVSQLGASGLCQLFTNPNASGSWTVHMSNGLPQNYPPPSPGSGQPDVVIVSFQKMKGSMGLSIVAAVGEGLAERGIYIKSVVPGGAAAMDGRLAAGDHLLEIDGQSLVGLSQDGAAELLMQTGDCVSLKVAMQGAMYHGLATLLNKPSPVAPPHGDLSGTWHPSSGNALQQNQGQFPPPPSGTHNRQGNLRDHDPRSMSTSNLNAKAPTKLNGNMRTALSASVLEPPASQHLAHSAGLERPSASHYHPHSVDFERQSASRHALYSGQASASLYSTEMQSALGQQNNYMNQPQISPGSGQGSFASHEDRHSASALNALPCQQNNRGFSDRSSVSSRTSSNGAREAARPQSAYYKHYRQQPHPKQDSYSNRPKSDEISKLQCWHESFEPCGDHQTYVNPNPDDNPHYINHSGHTVVRRSGEHSPPYVNHSQLDSMIRAKQTDNSSATQQNSFKVHCPIPDGHLRQAVDQGNDVPTLFYQQQRSSQQTAGVMKRSAHDRLFNTGPMGAMVKPGTNNQQKHPTLSIEMSVPFDDLHQPSSHQQPPRISPSGNQPLPKSFTSKPPIPRKPLSSEDVPPISQHSNLNKQLDNAPVADDSSGVSYLSKQQTQTYLPASIHLADSPVVPYYKLNALRGESIVPEDFQQHQFMQENNKLNLPPICQPEKGSMSNLNSERHNVMVKYPTEHIGTMVKTCSDLVISEKGPQRSHQDSKNLYNQSSLFSNISVTLHSPGDTDHQSSIFHVCQQDDNRLSYTADKLGSVSPKGFQGLSVDPGSYIQPFMQSVTTSHQMPLHAPSQLTHSKNAQHPTMPSQVDYGRQFQSEHFQGQFDSSSANFFPASMNTHLGSFYNGGDRSAHSSEQTRDSMVGGQHCHNSTFNRSYPREQVHPLMNYQNASFITEAMSSVASDAQATIEQSILQGSAVDTVKAPHELLSTESHQHHRALPSEPHSHDAGQWDLPRVEDPSLGQQVIPLAVETLNKKSFMYREKHEQAEEKHTDQLFEARRAEINELESRSYLGLSEQERLRSLKLEHEFQRRVKEVDEKGDYDADDDDDMMERLFTRERLIQSVKENVENHRKRIEDLDHTQQLQAIEQERERMQRLERRLEMMEKDRLEIKERMQRRQKRNSREHQKLLKQQQESREKQRLNYEEQKRLMMHEEEKMRQRREEEMAMRHQMERRKMQELQMSRDREELQLRAEIRHQDTFSHRLPQTQNTAHDWGRRVTGESQPLGAVNNVCKPPVVSPISTSLSTSSVRQNGAVASATYQPYMNIDHGVANLVQAPPHPPPPPERKSSYNTTTALRNGDVEYRSVSISSASEHAGSRTALNGHPAVTHHQAVPAFAGSSTVPKKSVTFNTEMNTYQDRTPSCSLSSEHMSPLIGHFAPGDAYEGSQTPSSAINLVPGNSSIVSVSTPTVIGAQEIYRYPQSRVAAQKAADAQHRLKPADRMSFTEKMKYFAKEAGEETPRYKPKISKTLRNIELQLNGQ